MEADELTSTRRLLVAEEERAKLQELEQLTAEKQATLDAANAAAAAEPPLPVGDAGRPRAQAPGGGVQARAQVHWHGRGGLHGLPGQAPPAHVQ